MLYSGKKPLNFVLFFSELGNDEVNDGYKLLQRKDLFYEMLVVLSICVALLGALIQFNANNIYSCYKNITTTSKCQLLSN